MLYVVQNTEEPTLFWSNTLGWIEGVGLDLFTPEEREAFSPPMGGKWVPSDAWHAVQTGGAADALGRIMQEAIIEQAEKGKLLHQKKS